MIKIEEGYGSADESSPQEILRNILVKQGELSDAGENISNCYSQLRELNEFLKVAVKKDDVQKRIKELEGMLVLLEKKRDELIKEIDKLKAQLDL